MGNAQKYALGFRGQEGACFPSPYSQNPSAEFTPHMLIFKLAAKVHNRDGSYCVIFLNVVNTLYFVAKSWTIVFGTQLMVPKTNVQLVQMGTKALSLCPV